MLLSQRNLNVQQIFNAFQHLWETQKWISYQTAVEDTAVICHDTDLSITKAAYVICIEARKTAGTWKNLTWLMPLCYEMQAFKVWVTLIWPSMSLKVKSDDGIGLTKNDLLLKPAKLVDIDNFIETLLCVYCVSVCVRVFVCVCVCAWSCEQNIWKYIWTVWLFGCFPSDPKVQFKTIGEYLAPQIRRMNNRFHSEAKLPWSYDYPLANHFARNKSYANREMPLFSRLCPSSGIFWTFSRQWVLNTPYSAWGKDGLGNLKFWPKGKR